MATETGTVGHYPPRTSDGTDNDEQPTLSPSAIKDIVKKGHSDRKFAAPHPIWATDKLKYTAQNWWSPGLSKEKRENCRRGTVAGVEVRDLHPPHFLAGEQGLFAIEKFSRFDVIGEYTGRIVDDDVSGHYVAALEDKTTLDSLGLDAQDCGNEMRFINSYLNVDFAPNVTMRTVYINTYPHICIVCTRDIDVGDEILLDYGDAYNKAFLTPPPPPPPPIPPEVLDDALPCGLMDDIEAEERERERKEAAR